ncbi:MAG: hypothetical protein JXR69_07325 [Candidatus Delongbacteria bacterium]|nr:hypothetical protein [Candidatus Delongbacteria bacterium]
MRIINLTLLLALIVLTGCKITGQYIIDQSGEGTGKIIVENFNKNIFLARLREDEKYKKIEITSIDSIDPDLFHVNIKWEKFEDVFKSMKKLEDGNIELNLGTYEFPITVKIDGVIDPKKSTGELLEPDKMEFKYSKAILTYLPEENFSFMTFLLITLAVLIIYFLLFRRK